MVSGQPLQTQLNTCLIKIAEERRNSIYNESKRSSANQFPITE